MRLVVPRGRFGRNAYRHSFGIGSDSLAEAKNGRGVGRGAHSTNGDSRHDTAEQVKLARAHVAVEKIIHVGVGDKPGEGVTSGSFFYYRSGQGRLAFAEEVDCPERQWLCGETKTVVAERHVPFIPVLCDPRQSLFRAK